VDSFSDSSGATICSPCQAGYHQSRQGQTFCVKIDAISGVLSNQGTPLYIIALLCVAMGAFGLFANQAKVMHSNVMFLPSTFKAITDFSMFAAGVGSEMVLASGLIGSIDSQLNIFGIVLIVSRVCMCSVPALLVLVDIMRSDSSLYKHLLYSTKLYKDSKVYVLILVMSIFDCKVLTHIPWLKGDFVQASMAIPLATFFTYVSCLLSFS
jgi:hypothetical protein